MPGYNLILFQEGFDFGVNMAQGHRQFPLWMVPFVMSDPCDLL